MATANDTPSIAFCAEFAFVGRAVEVYHQPVNVFLCGGVHTDDLRGDFIIYIFNRAECSFAHVPLAISIAQLNGLVSAGACAGGHGSPSE